MSYILEIENSMPNNNYNILVVDDDKDILELLKYNLEKEGYQIKKNLPTKEELDLVWPL